MVQSAHLGNIIIESLNVLEWRVDVSSKIKYVKIDERGSKGRINQSVILRCTFVTAIETFHVI